MPRPKDAKIWNEDLIAALEARYQQSLREGKRDEHTWRVGMQQITAVRKDIYQFRTGNIANLPTGLTKKVQRCCEDIIRGIKNVYPDGHVPTNGGGGVRGMGGSFGSAAAVTGAAASTGAGYAVNSENPFNNANYMKNIKIRGGAYAILMAFHNSRTDVLTKRQICQEAQPFCDEQLEANYLGGRPRGAWSSIATLKSHHFRTEQGFTTHTGRGFRDRPHEYTLTRDGRLFIEALLAHRPEAAAAAGQAVGGASRAYAGVSGSMAAAATAFGGHHGSPFARTLNYMPPSLAGPARSSSSRNIDGDRAELEQWIATAEEGDQKDFKVGKERRKHLHRLCNSLQEDYPGLLLTHSSSGTARARILTIQVVAKSSSSLSSLPSSAIGRKRPMSPASPSNALTSYGQCTSGSVASPAAKRSRDLTPAQNAALAAMRRQDQAKADAEQKREEAELKRAIAESAKMAETPPQPRRTDDDIQEIDNDDDDDEEAMLQRALKESLEETSKKPAAKQQRSQESFTASATRRDDCRKRPASTSAKSMDVISSDSDSDDSDILEPVDFGQKKDSNSNDVGKKAESKAHSSSRLQRGIDLSQSSDDNEPIEIQDSQEEPIDLLDSQPQTFDNSEDDDDVVIIDNDSSNRCASAAVPPTHHTSDFALTVMIDNRERNRNATPRTLRMELSRHFASGPLGAVWPAAVPPAQVEEVALEWGDFGYQLTHIGSGETLRLGVSVERKRINDLVQRSYDGDHLTQLFRMRQHCTLSILLIEYDTRMASSVTAYNAQNREGFDSLDTTITCEDDVFLMFGRVLLTSDTIKFIQTKEEQSSLRAIGAIGLMSMSAPSERSRELCASAGSSSKTGDAQALCDRLKQGGIPWRLAKRAASAVGGLKQLDALYQSCCNEEARSKLLSHLFLDNNDRDQCDLRSSAGGWSDAIYHIMCSRQSNGTGLTGEAALLKYKDLVEDHGRYLSFLHGGCSPEEALNRILSSPSNASAAVGAGTRSVLIRLTEDQAAKYFPAGDSGAFYDISTAPSREISGNISAITMCAVCGSLTSKKLLIFEMEGSEIVEIIQDAWNNHNGSDFIALTRKIAKLIDDRCRPQGTTSTSARRIILICGLQPALDDNAKKPGYRSEIKTVLDMVCADLMLRYDVTIIQALRKKMEDRVNVVRQLALACLHYGFLVESGSSSGSK